MGLQHGTYRLEGCPDWTRVQSALEASTGVHVKVVRDSETMARVRAWRIGGSADLWFADGRLEWEAPLSVNVYFLAHLHDAFDHIGAMHQGEFPKLRIYSGVPWRQLPLRRRLAWGVVGQSARGLFWLAMMPFIFTGFLLANLFLLTRKGLRRLFRR